MKVTQEMLDKLSRQDRIDYIEQRKEILGGSYLLFFSTYVFWTIYIVAFSFIVFPLWKLAFPDLLPKIGYLFVTLEVIMLKIIVFGLAIDIILLIIKLIHLNKLKKRYFKNGKVRRRR